MREPHKEWLKQAEYDMSVAESMFAARHYFYAVYMCHLSVEKALKGLYHLRRDKVPPKTHNLARLLNDIGLRPPATVGRFIAALGEAHVVTRYPADLEALQKSSTASVVRPILDKGKDVLRWINEQFSTP